MRAARLIIAVSLAACGRPPEPAPAPRPRVSIAPSAVAFGRVTSGQQRVVTVRNLGEAGSVLHLQAPTLDSPDFGVAVRGELELATSAFTQLVVTATPPSPGWKSADLELSSDDPGQPLVRIPITATALATGPCELQVAPSRLDFGTLLQPVDLAVTVRSSGADACVLTGVGLEPGSDAAFSVPGGQVPLELLPGESRPLRVTASPVLASVEGPVTGVLLIEGRRVALAATLVASCLVVAPNDHDFGTVRVGCRSPVRSLAIYNTCSTPVDLTSLRIVGDGFQLDGSPLVPSTLPPGAAPVSVRLRYVPGDAGAATGAVILGATRFGKAVDYVVTLRGTGDVAGTQTDTFHSDARPKLDVLFVIDDSASMASHRASVASNIDDGVRALLYSGDDLQLAVTTSDGTGTLLGSPPIVTDTTPDAGQRIADRVAAIGTSGSDITQLLASAAAAVTANPGLARAGAQLTIVTVSDNDDRSPQVVGTYVDQLRLLAPSASLLAVGPVSPTAPAGCTYDTSGGQPRSSAAAAALFGLQEDICYPDWNRAFPTCFDCGGRTTYFLTATPEPTSIVVRIDGVTVPAYGWSYDPVTNAVWLSPLFALSPGSVLEVSYRLACS